MWSPKSFPNEVEPEGTGKEKDWDLRDQLQKKTLQLQAKEKEVRGWPETVMAHLQNSRETWEAAKEQGFQSLGCNWIPTDIHLPT